MSSESGNPINFKAERAAEKARAKALRPWYKKKRFMIPLIFVAAGVISSLSGGTSDTGTSNTSAKSDTSSSVEAAPGIGTQVSDGKFTFVVNAVKCGVATVGESFLEVKAQGQFCIVDVNVANTGNESQSVDISSMYLYDAADRKFSTTSSAMLSMEGSDLWLTDINPGNSIEGQLIFDLPKDASPVSIELHDSMFSDGVTVKVAP